MMKSYFIGPLVAVLLASCGGGGGSSGVTPKPQITYIPNEHDGTVSMYTIGSNGVPTPLDTSPLTTVSGQTNMVVTPNKKFAYIVNVSGYVSMYSIDTDGRLTSLGNTPTVANTQLTDITINPAGTFAYVLNFAGGDVGTILCYSIDSNGILTQVDTNLTTATVTNLGEIAINPAGTFMYVLNRTNSGTVQEYKINVDGSLTLIGAVATRETPYAIAINPAGTFAYVVNTGGGVEAGTVSMYSINNGYLTPLATSPLTVTGTNAPVLNSITIHPAGTYAYITDCNNNTILTYSINDNGTLTEVSTNTITTQLDGHPESININPAGTYVYTRSIQYLNTPNIQFIATILTYSIASNGSLTQVVNTPDVTTGINSKNMVIVD